MGSHTSTLLLVEDNPRDVFVFREAIAGARTGAAYKVEHAGSLGEALRRLAREQFDLVVLDLTLPDSRGYETYEKVRSLARNTPVILMTAVEDEQLASRAVRDGAQDYLVKSQLSSALILHCMRYAIERHQTREELRLSHEKLQRLNLKYQAVLRSTPNGLCILNSFWRVTYANAAMQQLFGAEVEGSSEGVSGLEFQEFFPSEMEFETYRDNALQAVRMQGLYRRELQLKSQDGRVLWCDVALTRIDPTQTASGYAITITDVTARKEAEAQRDWLVAAVEQANEAILITDTDWCIEYANPAFEHMTGYQREEVLGQRPSLSLNSGNYEELFRDTVAKAIQCEGHWGGRFTSRRKDKSSYEEEVTIRPICDDSGAPKHYVIVRRDITREISLESELRQSQKMEAIGLLAGGIAHDFNNILQVVIGQGDLLLYGLQPGDPMREDLERIVNAGKRGAALTRQLLAFSRKQSMLPQVMDLNRAVTEVAKLLERLIGEDIHLELELHPNLSPINADPAQLEQVLINMAVNARDAMPKGGQLIITTDNKRLGEDFVREHVGVLPGQYVHLRVEDTGTGMPPEVMARIFDPFFTTKEVGRGTGLGLAMAYGVVRQCGGHIFVQSEPDHGTSFDIYLPQIDAAVEANQTPIAPHDDSEKEQTILLVEDESDVCDLVRMLLEQAGYNVLTASNGAEALLVAQHYQGPIHLLLTDVVMPEKSGPELAQELLRVRPDTRLLFMSGYTEHAVSQRNLLAPGAPLIQKPFGPSALIPRVREILERESRRDPAERMEIVRPVIERPSLNSGSPSSIPERT
jgi:PAS domain S-box-containing protein